MTLALPKSTARFLTELTGDPRPETALLVILRDAIAHRLERVEAALRDYEAKYGMSFEAYKRLWETEDRPEHYSYEAETDYLEWEALVTRKRRLEDLYPFDDPEGHYSCAPAEFESFLREIEGHLSGES